MDSSRAEESSSISSSEDEQQFNTSTNKRRPASKQLRYYFRKTAGKAKRKYTRYSDQKNPSKQLRRYHLTRKKSYTELSATQAESLNDNNDPLLSTEVIDSDHDSLTSKEGANTS